VGADVRARHAIARGSAGRHARRARCGCAGVSVRVQRGSACGRGGALTRVGKVFLDYRGWLG